MPSPALACAAAVLTAAASAALGAPAAHAAEGPGYGGNAGALSVTWTQSDEVLRAMGPAEQIQVEADGLSLDVFGLGFRGRSEVTVRVGTNPAVASRVDPTGTLDLSVGVQRLTEGPQPGTSVIVIGRAPSGTSRTLVGAVPPLPSGLGPADVVPWLALGMLAAAVAVRARRRPAPPAA